MAEARSTWVYIAGAAAALAVVFAIYIVVQRTGRQTPPQSTALAEEERAYLREIVVTDAHMSAAENLAGGTVTYLDALVTNQGAKLVRQLEIQLEFHDALNQVVLREKARPVTLRTSPLKPGETRTFRASFEHLPADWNHAPPVITTTQVHL